MLAEDLRSRGKHGSYPYSTKPARPPIPAGTHSDLAFGVQEEGRTASSGVEVDVLLDQGGGLLPRGATGPLAPHLGRAGGGATFEVGGRRRAGPREARGAGLTVMWCCGASRVLGGKRYMHTGKSSTSCCSTKPPRSTVSSSDWLRMRTNLWWRLTATIFRQVPLGLGLERRQGRCAKSVGSLPPRSH